MLNGKRLLELPTKTITVDELDFSEDERAIYNSVEQRAQGKSLACSFELLFSSNVS